MNVWMSFILMGLVCVRARVSNSKMGQNVKDVVIVCGIIHPLASPHLVGWCLGFDQHNFSRSQFV